METNAHTETQTKTEPEIKAWHANRAKMCIKAHAVNEPGDS